MRTVGLGVTKNGKPNNEELAKKVSSLEKENADLKKEVDSLKKKAKASAEKKEVSVDKKAEKKENADQDADMKKE